MINGHPLVVLDSHDLILGRLMYTVCLEWAWIKQDPMLLHAFVDKSEQTFDMRRIIRGAHVLTCDTVFDSQAPRF